MSETRAAHSSLTELALLFLKLGCIAFGGPAAHIAMMRDEVVRRRRWLSDEEFLDLLGATNLIPGPNSTELAIHIGHKRGGFPGLVIAGACFILPAMLIVLCIAWAYVRFGALPQAKGILYGVKPVIIAIVLQALWALGRSAMKTKFLAWAAIVATALSFSGVNELVVLFGVGIAVASILSLSGNNPGARLGNTPVLLLHLFRKPLLGAVAPGAVLTAVVTWALARAALVDWLTTVLATISALLLMRTNVNTAWWVIGGALVGLAATRLGFAIPH